MRCKLLAETEVTSIDYNNVYALVQGSISSFMGFTFKRYESISVDGSSDQLVYCFHPTGVGLAIGQDINARMSEWACRLRIAFFEFTQGSSAGDATSTATLVKLPAGKVRLILPLSYIGASALGSSRTMDLGWQAYVNDAGTTVAADPNGLDDGIDVSSATTSTPGRMRLYFSRPKLA